MPYIRKLTNHNFLTVITTVAVCIFAFFLFTHNKADVDLWGNVGFVKQLPISSEFHRVNTFSFTEPSTPWINHEWGAEYIFHQTYRFFGNPGLLILKAILGFILIGIIYNYMRERCGSAATRVIYLLLIISTLGYGFSTRPHLFTYILIALVLSELLRFINNSANPHTFHIAYIPYRVPVICLLALPLGCLWANLHGAFFIGQIIFLVAFIYVFILRLLSFDTSWHKSIILALSSMAFFAGSLINPYGISLWGFVFDSAAIMRPILSEWAPFNPITDFYDNVDFIALAVVTTIAVLISFRKTSVFALIVLVLSLLAAIGMRRNIPIFAIVAGITSSGAVGQAFGKSIDNIVNAFNKYVIILLMLSGAIISSLFFVKANKNAPMQITVPRDQFPIEAVEFLKRNEVKGNAIVFFDWAEECIWNLYPNIKVFLDGRFKSAYSESTITSYLSFIYAKENYLSAINDYPTDLVFAHINNPCTEIMRKQKDWQVIYQDQMAVIFVKRGTHKELLHKIQNKSVFIPTGKEVNIFP